MDQATNENSADLKRLFRIFKTVVQMMMDRGTDCLSFIEIFILK